MTPAARIASRIMDGLGEDSLETRRPLRAPPRRRRRGRVRGTLRRLLRRGPRRWLRVTRSGAVVLVLALAVGFAAFNTGNNLLFFGWGLLLSSILVSGILSDATLAAVTVEPRAAQELRARQPAVLPFAIDNRRSVPAFAVEVQALFYQRSFVARSFVLRLGPRTRVDANLAFSPPRRGPLLVEVVRVLTAFPFGFFEKEKRVFMEIPLDFVVFPARIDVGVLTQDLLTRLGDTPAQRVGAGDELFSLRPFRAGDDPRKIAWRRSARTGRPVIKETEAANSRDVVLELCVPAGVTDEDLDHAADVCGSLAEELLGKGYAVGFVAPGVSIPAARGARQRSALLTELALVTSDSFLSPSKIPPRAVVIAVIPNGGARPAHASVAIDADAHRPERQLEQEPPEATVATV